MANTSTNVKALSSVLGDKATVGLINFFFDEEDTLDIAQSLDSYDLLDKVNHEANAKIRLEKSTVLLGLLKASRTKMAKNGADAAKKYGEESVNFKNAVRAVNHFDEAIAKVEKSIAALTQGVQVASQWVDRKQMEIQVNVAEDQITLTNSAINAIVADQVEFTQEMIEALPKTKLSSKIRKSVKSGVEDGTAQNTAKLEIYTRMLGNQAGEDDGDGVEDTSAYAEMLKMAGIEPKK